MSSDARDDVPTPADVDDLRVALVALDRGLAPIGSDDVGRHHIGRMVGKLALLYPSPNMSDAEAAGRLALYVDLLADLPPDLLADAFRRVAQTVKFFPTVAEIRAMALPAFRLRQFQRGRCNGLIELHEREWSPPVEISEAEAAEVRAGLRDLAARLARAPDPVGTRPLATAGGGGVAAAAARVSASAAAASEGRRNDSA